MPLWERLSRLRLRARTEARSITNMLSLYCILLGLSFILIVLGYAALLLITNRGEITHPTFQDLAAIWSIAVLGTGVIIYSVFRLLVSRKLFQYHYQQAWRYLAHTDLAPSIALDPFFNEICFRLAENGQHISYYLPYDPSLETALEIRCGFINSYIAAIWNGKSHGTLPWDSQGWIAFRLAAEFKPGWLKYLGCLGGCIFSLGTNLFRTAAVKMTVGPAIIMSRAVLVAFLDFMLEEPPAWVERLTPPSDAKRSWWWRSVAPLLRDAG